MNDRQQFTDDEPPFTIQAGGPTAADERVTIEDGHCERCGYDRVKITQKHGEVIEHCMHCDAYTFDNWATYETPTSDGEDCRQMREYADDPDSPVVKHGEYGPSSLFSHGHEVFGYEDSDVLHVYQHPKHGGTDKTTLRRTTLEGIVRTLQNDDDFLVDLIDDLSPIKRTELLLETLPDDVTLTKA